MIFLVIPFTLKIIQITIGRTAPPAHTQQIAPDPSAPLPGLHELSPLLSIPFKSDRNKEQISEQIALGLVQHLGINVHPMMKALDPVIRALQNVVQKEECYVLVLSVEDP